MSDEEPEAPPPVTQDVRVGHAAPTILPARREHLLARLREVNPKMRYVFKDDGGPVRISVRDELDQESWSWTLPMAWTPTHWILTVEEFLAMELFRHTGKNE